MVYKWLTETIENMILSINQKRIIIESAIEVMTDEEIFHIQDRIKVNPVWIVKPSLKVIRDFVCSALNVSTFDFESKSRKKEFNICRQYFVWLAIKIYCPESFVNNAIKRRFRRSLSIYLLRSGPEVRNFFIKITEYYKTEKLTKEKLDCLERLIFLRVFDEIH